MMLALHIFVVQGPTVFIYLEFLKKTKSVHACLSFWPILPFTLPSQPSMINTLGLCFSTDESQINQCKSVLCKHAVLLSANELSLRQDISLRKVWGVGK